ncbi:MAG: phenylacetate--CoA ligase [Acidimicrobiia bacterium]
MTTPIHPTDFTDLGTDQLRRTQSERLAALIERLRAVDSPFWARKLTGVGEVRSVDDLGTLPVTEKAEFREAYPTGMLAVPLTDVVRVHASSGTSGKPTIVAYTADDIAVFAEVNARALALAGGTADSVVQVAYGYGLFTGGLGLHYGVEALGATAVPASGGNPGFQAQLIADLGVDGLACTPSFALLLAERAEADGLMGDIGLRWGIHGAEPWSEGLRTKIEEAWGGDYSAVDIYGLSEIIGPGVAAEWAAHPGTLVIAEDHFYPEVVDPFSGEPVAEGELGELVLTTLTKQAQPVLRYRTGDITRLLPPEGGLPFRRIDRLQGRVDDMLIIRGINVYPREIETVLLADPDLGGQYAIVVDRRGTLDEVEVRVETAHEASDPARAEIATRLAAELMESVRLRIAVDVRNPGGVPRQEVGKAKRVFERTGDVDPVG